MSEFEWESAWAMMLGQGYWIFGFYGWVLCIFIPFSHQRLLIECFLILIVLDIWSIENFLGTSITLDLHEIATDQLMGSIHDSTNSHLDQFCELGRCRLRNSSNLPRCGTSSEHRMFVLMEIHSPRLNGSLDPAQPTLYPSLTASSP